MPIPLLSKPETTPYMGTPVKRPSECDVLVVDDEEVICTLLETAVKDLCRVQTCHSGSEALSLIETRDFDIVIADINLPDISGMEILKAARKKDDYTELLIVTGYASLETAAEAIGLGVSSYLMKPLSIVDLRIQVERSIANRLFHLKSIMLMQRSDDIAPDIKGHVYDITSLFRFSRKLMLSLEVPEVTRVILEEINDRMNVLYSVIGIKCGDIRELYAMPCVGSENTADIRQSIVDKWDNAFPFLDRVAFAKNKLPFTAFNGRHDEPFTFEKTPPLVLQFTVMNRHIGSLAIFGKKGFSPSPDELQFLHVFTSFVSSIIEHSCLDMHAKMQARTDGLTGIANHRAFHESLSREIARADRSGSAFGLILMDIDDFKKINDTHGHLVGDAVIRDLVARVSDMIRRSDTFARYGGEEFALILPDTGLEGAKILAHRICREISATPFVFSQATVSYSVSIGLSMYDGKIPRLKNLLINDADKAMYKSKADGKNRVSVG
jgi:two-component system, cell cycle response regulator